MKDFKFSDVSWGVIFFPFSEKATCALLTIEITDVEYAFLCSSNFVNGKINLVQYISKGRLDYSHLTWELRILYYVDILCLQTNSRR